MLKSVVAKQRLREHHSRSMGLSLGTQRSAVGVLGVAKPGPQNPALHADFLGGFCPKGR